MLGGSVMWRESAPPFGGGVKTGPIAVVGTLPSYHRRSASARQSRIKTL